MREARRRRRRVSAAAEEASAIAARMRRKKGKAATLLQRAARQMIERAARRRAFLEKLCGEQGIFMRYRFWQILLLWRGWAQQERRRWEKGVRYGATRAGYVWVAGDRKEFARQLVLYHDRLEVLDVASGRQTFEFHFGKIRSVDQGTGFGKKNVTITLKNLVREVFTLVNAEGFMEEFRANFLRWVNREGRKNRRVARAHLSVFSNSDAGREDFRPDPEIDYPSAEERRAAVGDVSGLPPPLQLACCADGDKVGLFGPAQAPWKDEWAVRFRRFTRGETYDEWAKLGAPVPCGNNRNKIYLVALGDLDEDRGGCELRRLAQFLRAYFYGVEVVELPRMPLCGLHRDRGMRLQVQLSGFEREKAIGVANKMLTFDPSTVVQVDQVEPYLKELLPFDAFVLFAVTMHDVCVGKDYSDGNYLMSQPHEREQSMDNRTAVLSLARLDPWFRFAEAQDPEVREHRVERSKILLRRSCLWAAHHVMQFFSMGFCIYHACAMNGFINLEEAGLVPLHVCPVCLRKLMDAIGIKTTQRCVDRFHALRTFCRVNRAAFPREYRWLSARTRTLEKAFEEHQKNEKLRRMFGEPRKERAGRAWHAVAGTARLPSLAAG